jgi:Cellulose biosynthesis protein BcsS
MYQMRSSCVRWVSIGAMAIAFANGAGLRAEPDTGTSPPSVGPPSVGQREFWVGADAGPHNWLVYAGGTYAPASDIHGDGIRLRSTTGYGQYSYYFNSRTKVNADKKYVDALIGYQHRFGELTAKGFVGWAVLDSTFAVPSRGLTIERINHGPKAAIELWLNLGNAAFTSLDMNYAMTRDTWAVRSRTGYRVLPTLSVGVEAAFNHADLRGEVEKSRTVALHGSTRIGAFARYEWFGGEISASGGLAGDWIEPRGSGDPDPLHKPQAYGTLNWIVQY